MRLYFIPFACSLAARAAIDAAGLDAEFVQVKPQPDLGDRHPFRKVNPLGYVPALELDDGCVLTEGPAVLQWIADQAPAARLAPPAGDSKRYELHHWLNFVSTELHKGVFTPLLDPKAPDGAKAYARAKLPALFAHLTDRLSGRDHLMDELTVADFYLLSVLNWCETSGVDIDAWPVLAAYRERLRKQPSMARASATELPLLKTG